MKGFPKGDGRPFFRASLTLLLSLTSDAINDVGIQHKITG